MTEAFTVHALRGVLVSAGLLAALPAGAAPAAAPVITGQPQWQVLQVGQRAGFLVKADNATGYQWYAARPGSGPTAVPGGTAPFLLTAPAAQGDDGTQYSVIVTGPGGSTRSGTGTLYIGPNADGSPPDSVLAAAGDIPAARNVMTLAFLNASLGRVPDSQMFWSLQYRDGSGNTVKEAHSFAEKPYFDLPKVGGTRLYVYVAPDAASIGTGQKNYFDFLELNVGQDANNGPYWINMDTTRVDRWGLPVAFRLQCGDGTVVERGDDVGLFVDDRDVTLMKYQAELGSPWNAAAQQSWPYGIDEPGAAGFGKNGPYSGYYSSYIDEVWRVDGLTIPKPTNFLDLATQLPDLSGALNRHVAAVTGAFNPDGTLADKSFWSKHPPTSFYGAIPSNFYSAFWHEHAISHLQYGFPYDDDASQSSDVGCKKPQSLIVGVGF
ncbi:beta-1,3-glucanase family protein [Rhizosaccharibacter radicis]|uniref:Beta-1,3-glucanase family protein n=1 Tax=Rhizosaccharibacter radicis TaxID=2782605 RepID=A0ABT1VUR0_9PROT|nr:beta-1,3-glucanase family protein [Acetobacteraceae bacterium KSS12]